MVLWAVLPATVCVAMVTGLFQRGGQNAAGLIHLTPGWMQGEHPFFQYWFSNFGILPILVMALLAWMVVRYKEHREAREGFAFVFPMYFHLRCGLRGNVRALGVG